MSFKLKVDDIDIVLSFFPPVSLPMFFRKYSRHRCRSLSHEMRMISGRFCYKREQTYIFHEQFFTKRMKRYERYKRKHLVLLVLHDLTEGRLSGKQLPPGAFNNGSHGAEARTDSRCYVEELTLRRQNGHL